LGKYSCHNGGRTIWYNTEL